MSFTTDFYQALGTIGGHPAQILLQTTLSLPVIGALGVLEEALQYVNPKVSARFSADLENARGGVFSAQADMATTVEEIGPDEQRYLSALIQLSRGPTARLFQSDQIILKQARRGIGSGLKPPAIVSIEKTLETRAEQLRTVADVLQKAGYHDAAADIFMEAAKEEAKRVRHFREARNPAGLVDSLFKEGELLEAAADALRQSIEDIDLEEALSFGKLIPNWIRVYNRMDSLYSEAILRFRLTNSFLQEANLLVKRGKLLKAVGFLHVRGEEALAAYLKAFTEFVKARFVFDEARIEEPLDIVNDMADTERSIKNLADIKILPPIDPAIERAQEIVQWIISRGGRIVVLTGAGISAESGIPTFRDAPVLWEGENILDVLNGETLTRNPEKFWRFLRFAMRELEEADPNPGHQALVAMEKDLGKPITIVTQNVDNLHRRAGSRKVLEIHGNLFRFRCANSGCDFTTERKEMVGEKTPHCPRCQSLLRPAIILFSEELPQDQWQHSLQAAREADLFIVIGTSGVAWPASDLATVAGDHGAFILQINLTAIDANPTANIFLEGKAGEILPQLARRPK